MGEENTVYITLPRNNSLLLYQEYFAYSSIRVNVILYWFVSGSLSFRLYAFPYAGLCFFHLCILSPSNVIDSLCVSLVTKEEEGRHMGRRRDHGGISMREGKLRNWWRLDLADVSSLWCGLVVLECRASAGSLKAGGGSAKSSLVSVGFLVQEWLMSMSHQQWTPLWFPVTHSLTQCFSTLVVPGWKPQTSVRFGVTPISEVFNLGFQRVTLFL